MGKKYFIPHFSIHKTNFGKEWEAWNVNYVFRAPTREELEKKIADYFEAQHQRDLKRDFTPALETFATGCCFFCKQPIATPAPSDNGPKGSVE